jgi:8-oxo-dGTP pyrophosphatase MutT (NUDIX family)
MFVVNGVVMVITNDFGEVAIGKKCHREGHFLSDMWHMPGGKRLDGEEIVGTIRREAEEELSMKIEIGKLICEKRAEDGFVIGYYWCKAIDNGKIVCGGDLVEAKWVKKEKVLEELSEMAKEMLPEEVGVFIEDL